MFLAICIKLHAWTGVYKRTMHVLAVLIEIQNEMLSYLDVNIL